MNMSRIYPKPKKQSVMHDPDYIEPEKQLSVYEKIQRGDYKNKLEIYDKKPLTKAIKMKNLADQLMKLSVEGPQVKLSFFEIQARKHIERVFQDSVDYVTEQEEEYQKIKDAYGKMESELHQQFRKDLEEENGMTDHLKRDALFNKAWEDGHSSGINEVALVYSDLVDLVK